MNYKNILIITILLLVLSVATVSAADFDNNYVTESSDGDDSISIEDSFTESSEIQDLGVLSDSVGTFDDLQLEIDNAQAAVLNLTRDYNGREGAIVNLNKDLTIDGQGHTIDCLNAEGCTVFYSSSGNITLKNLRIINGNGGDTDKGGVITIRGSAQYTIENCIFENNFAKAGGVIRNNVNKTLTIKNSIFNSNNANTNGGGIGSTGYLIIENSVFDSCTVNNSCGGAIMSSVGGIIENSIFKNCLASYSGGAIHSYKDLIINSCIFENNKIDGEIVHDSNGGAICCYGVLYIDNSTFKDNWADDYGGAVYGDDVYINYNQDDNQPFNTFFINNVADDINGGAIDCDNLYMKNTALSSNKAYVDGGAVNVKYDATMSNCLFESNSADGASSQCYGGAVLAGGNVYVDNSTFKDNYAHDYGGAIYATNVYINTNQANPRDFNSFFINNKLNDDKGGAIYAEGSVNAVNTVFSANRAEDSDGGAIYAKDVTANNCAFNNNYAENYGGAICSENTVNVNNCLFESNKVDDNGGAIYAKDATVNICTFNNNWAEDNGGAIYAAGLTIANTPSTFVSNTAYKGKGGAIYTNKFDKDVKYASFIGNRAGDGATVSDDGGAIYINDESWLSFESCLFANNHCTDEGGAIYLEDQDSKLSLINNIFLGNGADDEGTVVFNCGEYVIVNNNWWGCDFPEFNNVLVEWHGGAKSNENHYDTDPLRARLTIGATGMSVNYSIPVEFALVSPLGTSELNGLEYFYFESDHLGEFSDYRFGEYGFDAVFTPKDVESHKISVKNVLNGDEELVVAYINVDNSSGVVGNAQVYQNTDLSFSQFQNIVNEAPEGFIIDLNNDFVFYGADNVLNDKEGIIIDRDIVIDGHGHSFDAKSMSGIFQSSKGHVTLRNIVFKNGNQKSADDGGAIRILDKASYTIENCTFDSNNALQDGGAIYNEGGDLLIYDSTFTNNRAKGANKLNDCDGGAIHSKAFTFIRNCTFRNNYAADNGGAVYVTGGLQISEFDSSYFVYNTAYKGKGGAIYTNEFIGDVKFVCFIGNRAGDGATISDDGGAVYINNEDNVTFESCLFANNHCTDEGGAIYLDDMDSVLTLRYNIFINNIADDEGQTVFNCGYFVGPIVNNFWSDEPTVENDQLIKWQPLIESNIHEKDWGILFMIVNLDQVDCPVNTTVHATFRFIDYTNRRAIFDHAGMEFVTLSVSPDIGSLKTINNRNTVSGEFTPDKEGVYTVTANLFGYTVSKSVNVYKNSIDASEVTTFTNVPVTFKVHLNGDKQHTANQKIRVSFFRDYDLVTDANGDANVTFEDNLNLEPGRYRIDISANGFTAESAVNIISSIVSEDVAQVRGDHVEFNAQFSDLDGNYLEKGTQVEFVLDGNNSYYAYVDDEGNANVGFDSLSRGQHSVLIKNPVTNESKSYRVVILMGFGGTYNGNTNQSQESQNDAPIEDSPVNDNSVNVNSLDSNSLTGDLFYDYSLFRDNDISGDNVNATNQSTNSPVSKAIDNTQSNGGNNSLWWIILAILAVIVAGAIIKKYKE